jgi:hypothetical protein
MEWAEILIQPQHATNPVAKGPSFSAFEAPPMRHPYPDPRTRPGSDPAQLEVYDTPGAQALGAPENLPPDIPFVRIEDRPTM